MNRQEIETQLIRIAYQKSEPFCYGCYVRVKKDQDGRGRCPKCGSDDLARELAGEGMDWGHDWILPVLLRDRLTPANTEEAFEESIRDCFPETTKVGWLDLDTVTVLKDQDPVSWRIAHGEWIDSELEDDRLVSFDNGETYYWTHDVEDFLVEAETPEHAA